MAEPQYLLSPHAFACVTAFHWILLDLENDKYLAIHKRDFEPLASLLRHAEQTPALVSEAEELSSQSAQLLSDLVGRKLLSKNTRAGKCISAAPVAPPKNALSATDSGKRIAPYFRYVPAFLIAAAKADYRLRRQSIAQVVRSVTLRKRISRRRVHSSGPRAVEPLVRAFNALRPVYPRDYLCLFDSLALIEFLAFFDLFPTWVFGVTSDPFQAHCWVQESETVANDSLEYVEPFVPIMAV